jgi:hypothetical protein
MEIALDMTLERQIEQIYMDMLNIDGLNEDTIAWFREMAKINKRTLSYFVIAAMEDFRNRLDQDPDFILEFGEEEQIH